MSGKAKNTSGTLSDKFSKIAARNIAESGRQTRKIVVVRQQTAKRNVQANTKRGLTPTRRPQNKASERPAKKIGRVATGGAAGRGRGRGRGGGAGRGKSQGGRRDKDAKKPQSQADLDMELDSYWFAAGKGPNPVAAALDKDMDNYFKDRVPKNEAAVTTETNNA